MSNDEYNIEEIEAVGYHRNGVSGQPFTAAIVRAENGHRMLVIDFYNGENGDSSDNREERDTAFDYAIAVLDLDKAATGNIYMHEQYDANDNPIPGTGGNAWRGDEFAIEWRSTIIAERNRESDAQLPRVIRYHKKQEDK